MPLSSLRPLISERFSEVNIFLSHIAQAEGDDPLQQPDSGATRIMRGLFFVHLYGAFEYTTNQSFSRLAEHIAQTKVRLLDLHRPVCAVALDPVFRSIQDLNSWSKRWSRRSDLIAAMHAKRPAELNDTALGMPSVDLDAITLVFRIYGIADDPALDQTIKGYLSDVVQKRHAIAHGRTSPAEIGKMRSADLRKRYDAVYKQSIYMLDRINTYAAKKQFIISRRRAAYRKEIPPAHVDDAGGTISL